MSLEKYNHLPEEMMLKTDDEDYGDENCVESEDEPDDENEENSIY